MPTYDYRCESCGHEMEVFQGMTATPLRKCPKCGKNALKRLIGAGAGLIFKGSGFYCTDYKKGSGTCGSCPTGGKEKGTPCPKTEGGESKGSGEKGAGESKGDGEKKGNGGSKDGGKKDA